MANPLWQKRKTDLPIWGGPRVAVGVDVSVFDPEIQGRAVVVLDAMDRTQLIVFRYDGSDRVVAPFVLGVSSDGNALMRGYQIEGVSKGGAGYGWRVFQVRKMENLENHQDHFVPGDFDFDRVYPWVYSVIKML